MSPSLSLFRNGAELSVLRALLLLELTGQWGTHQPRAERPTGGRGQAVGRWGRSSRARCPCPAALWSAPTAPAAGLGRARAQHQAEVEQLHWSYKELKKTWRGLVLAPGCAPATPAPCEPLSAVSSGPETLERQVHPRPSRVSQISTFLSAILRKEDVACSCLTCKKAALFRTIEENNLLCTRQPYSINTFWKAALIVTDLLQGTLLWNKLCSTVDEQELLGPRLYAKRPSGL